MLASFDNQKVLLPTSFVHVAISFFHAIFHREKIYLGAIGAREIHRVTVVQDILKTRACVKPVTDKYVIEDGSHVQES